MMYDHDDLMNRVDDPITWILASMNIGKIIYLKQGQEQKVISSTKYLHLVGNDI